MTQVLAYVSAIRVRPYIFHIEIVKCEARFLVTLYVCMVTGKAAADTGY